MHQESVNAQKISDQRMENLMDMIRIGCSFQFILMDQDFYLAIDCKYKEDKPSTSGILLHKKNVKRLTLIYFEVTYEGERSMKSKFMMKAFRETVLNRRKSSIGFDYLFGAE